MVSSNRPLRDPAPTTPHIDAVCDDFEAEWLAQQVPKIEAYLLHVPEAQRFGLFEELLALDLEYRQRAGEPLEREPYKARFAAYATIVDEQFDNLPQAPPKSFDDVRLVDPALLFPRWIGDYELLGVLGRGGMGEVYRARHVHLDRVVALKILPEQSLSDAQAVSRFKQERKLLARLDHPYIVRAFDAREEGGKYMLAMEHIEGASLNRLAAQQQPIGIAEACELTRQAAEGLQYAYEHGLIHRDIKPSNLMLSNSGVLKILDFGLARTVLSELAGDLDHRTTMPVGTLDYMAPEQFDDAHRVDTRADIYSLGCTLFQLLCGSAPYSSENRGLLAKMKAHCMSPIPSLRQRRTDASPDLERILSRMLAKHPDDRFATPGEVATAIAPFAAGARLEKYCDGPLMLSRLVMPKSVDEPVPNFPTNADGQRDGKAPAESTSHLHEQFLQSLPFPVSELYQAALSPRTPAERRNSAYCLWEATLRMLGSVLLAKYAECQQRPSAPLQQALENLAWPSTGRWWQVVQELLPALTSLGDAHAAQISDLLLREERGDLPACSNLAAVLSKARDEQPPAQGAICVASLFDALTEYGTMLWKDRDKSQMSGALDEVGSALLAAMTELLARFDVLAGGRLRYVEKVDRQKPGSCTVDSIELSGSSPRKQTSFEAEHGGKPTPPHAGHLYLDFPSSSLPSMSVESPLDRSIAMDGLMWYDPESSEFFFLSARRDQPKSEYLCYKSGRTHRPGELSATLSKLLGRLLDKSLGSETLQRWAQQSRSTETTAPRNASHPPTRVIGDFELLSRIGAGGMGVVYRAWQRSLDRQVALKCVARSGDRQAETRFAREIRTLGRIEHPNLVKIYTSGSDDDRLFYAMELIEGATLASVCQKLQVNTTSTADVNLKIWRESLSTACAETRTAEQPVSGSIPVAQQRPIDGLSEPTRPRLASESYVRNIVHLIRQAADAVHAIHEAGAIHRDIKPGNIMVTSDGSQAVLMDLGLVQLADEVDGSLTRTTQFVGTLRYASPEQLLGRAMQIDRRTDVYSLGVTLWELLTLRPIYGANEQTSTPELIQRIQGEEPEPIRKHYPQVDRDLEAIVMKCLEKARAARYASAAELSADLGCWLRGERPLGVHSNLLVAWKKMAARHRRRVTTGGVLVGLLAATACLTAYFSAPKVEPPVPVTALVQQLPGLNGRWWFEETPWLIPAARTAAGEALSDPKTLAQLASTAEGPAMQLNLNDRDVKGIHEILKQAIKLTALATDPLVAKLEGISTESLAGDELADHLRDVLKLAQKQFGDHATEPENLHLLAALEHRIALISADQEAGKRANKLYQHALSLYDKDSPLYALCISDYAQLNAEVLDNYSVAMDQFKKLRSLQKAAPAAVVANMCAEADALNAQNDFLTANTVYEQALLKAKGLPEYHPLSGYVHKMYGWNLLDHWMVGEACKHFEAAKDTHSINSKGNALARIEYFHALHGLAMAERYNGDAKLARTRYALLIEEIRREIDNPNQVASVNRLLHQRLYNALERCADSTLYEIAIAEGERADQELKQACEDYFQAHLEAADPASKVAMTYKWIIAMALTKDPTKHETARSQFDLIAKVPEIGVGYDKERLNLLKKVAAAVLLQAEESAEARKAFQQVLSFAQSDAKRKTRRESLELQLLCAEILVATAANSEEVAQARECLDSLVQSFPSQAEMRTFLQRYRNLLSDP